eukprot:CAMPEP_0201582608 /NCGR_PEP_ID=MMETSP0190_2-20130828/87646_1 /ASSEMBLY_ACC=CAM_ASM_000263 /TAXON_ID=37353 /ORGANISM="Rosalina sp." /LENGTH=69 /DNA_ID=CAMNT_0048022837 /DNA_START=34 /DNA_END=239 /DNA_ORIENTATION=+
MEPKANEELDPLLKQLRASTSTTPWKKRGVLLVTIILILFVVYLIMSSVSPALKLNNNKNDIAMYNPSS